jgi:mannose-6-phosphate isomerase-like protein (cupin superfamily)
MTKGFVVPAGGGTHHQSPTTPGRFFDLKLHGHQTGDSIVLFEETVPAGTKSWHHLHHDSDEIVWVLEGEFSFKIGDEVFSGGPGTCAFFPRHVPHAWKNAGTGPGRAVFFYTPAAAGHYIEEMMEREARPSDEELQKQLERHRWEIVGPNPL